MEHTAFVWEAIPCQPLEWEPAAGGFPCIDLDEPKPEPASEVSGETQAEVLSPPAGQSVPAEPDVESFTRGIARWTQLEMESTFLREAGRILAFPLRVNTVVRLPRGRLPRVIEMLLPRLEEFVRHGYALRHETAAAMLKILLILEQHERARTLAGRVTALSGEHPEIRYHQALALFRLCRFDEARDHAAAAVQMDGASGNALLLLAVCQIRTGETAAAGETLADALPLFSGDEAVLRFALPWIRRCGRKDAVLDALTRIERMAPADAGVSLMLADALYERDRTGDACERYGRHQERLDRAARCRYGICLADLGREDEALQVFSSLLAVGDGRAELDAVLQNLHDAGNRDPGLMRLIAARLWARGQIDDCLNFCTRAGSRIETDSGLAFIAAQCYTQRGGYGQAISLLEQIPPGGGREDERQYLLGYALFLAGRKTEAVPCLEAGLRVPARQAAALKMLGEIATEACDHARAAGLYRRLSRVQPDEAGVVARAAWSSMRAGMTALAIEGFRELVRLLPECPEGWNNLGVLLARDGQYDEAARCFKTSLRILPGQPEAGKNLALVYDRVLRSRSAEYLERCAEDELSAPGRADG